MSIVNVQELRPSASYQASLDDEGIELELDANLEVQTVDQVRLCCNRAFLSEESYLKHKSESPNCIPGFVINRGSGSPVEEDKEDEHVPEFNPVIESISSLNNDDERGDGDAEEGDGDAEKWDDDDDMDVDKNNEDVVDDDVHVRVSLDQAIRGLLDNPANPGRDPKNSQFRVRRAWIPRIYSETQAEVPSTDAGLRPSSSIQFRNAFPSSSNSDMAVSSASVGADTLENTFGFRIANRPFQCPIKKCGIAAGSDDRLQLHIQRAHCAKAKYVCPLCPCRYFSNALLCVHVSKQHGKKKNNCRGKIMERLETTSDAIAIAQRSRVLRASDKGKEGYLKEASKVTSAGQSMPFRRVKNNVLLRGFYCPRCPYQVHSRKSMDRHVQAAHGGKTEFPCPRCTCQYHTQSALTQHIKVLHGAKSETESYFKGPVRNTNIYKCDIGSCPYSTRYTNTIDYHKMKAHVKDGLYPCKFCSCCYSRRDSLLAHIKKWHPTEDFTPKRRRFRSTRSPRKPDSPRSTEVEFGQEVINNRDRKTCDQCPYYNKNIVLVQAHKMSMHDPSRPFGCKFCSCRYLSQSALETHKRRVHSKRDKSHKLLSSASQNISTVETENIARTGSPLGYEKLVGGDGKYLYRCLFPRCIFVTKTATQAIWHFKSGHKLSRKYPCNSCSQRFITESKLLVHKRFRHPISTSSFGTSALSPYEKVNKEGTKGSSAMYKCRFPLCHYMINTVGRMKYHSKWAHNVARKFACELCPLRFSADCKLQWHITKDHTLATPVKDSKRNSAGRTNLIDSDDYTTGNQETESPNKAQKITCPIKGCTMIKSGSLQLHLQVCHDPASQFKCKLCVCKFKSTKGLLIHVAKFHITKRNLDLNDVSKSEDNLKEKRHQANRYSLLKLKCDLCKFRTDRSGLLSKHVNAAHNVNNQYKCTLCSCRFAYVFALHGHLFWHHGISKNKRASTSVKLKEIIRKRAQCSSVTTGTVAANPLQEKVNTLSQQETSKPSYGCSICGSKFRHAISLKWHDKYAHSKWLPNVKRYPCDLCPHVYDHEKGLNIHKSKAHPRQVEQQKLSASPKKSPSKCDIKISSFITEEEPSSSKNINASESGTDMVKCSLCPFESTIWAISDHRKRAHVPNGQQCPFCVCSFATMQGLKRHKAHKHTGKESDVKDKTERKLPATTEAVDHRESSGENTTVKDSDGMKKRSDLYECIKPDCKYTACFPSVIKRHIMRCHVKDGFPCLMCHYTFSTYHRLKCHIAIVHTDCEVPSEEFIIEYQKGKIKRNADDLNMQSSSKKLRTDSAQSPLKKPDEIEKKDKPEEVAQKSSSPKNRVMKCKLCLENCRGADSLRDHMRKHQSLRKGDVKNRIGEDDVEARKEDGDQSTRFRCTECPCIFRRNIELNLHMKLQHSSNRDKQAEQEVMLISDKEEEDTPDLEKQYDYTRTNNDENSANGSKSYYCNQCSYQTAFMANIHSHSRTSHYEGGHPCESCVCSFEKKISLIYHKLYVHYGVSQTVDKKENVRSAFLGFLFNGWYECGFCEHTVGSQPFLEEHFVKVHRDNQATNTDSIVSKREKAVVKTYGKIKRVFISSRLDAGEDKYVARKIHSCGAAFSSDLERSTVCNICQLRLKDSHVERHKQICHSRLHGALKCNFCVCKYPAVSALKKHLDWSHKLKNSEGDAIKHKEPLSSSSISDNRPFTCSKCGLNFELKSSLQTHVKVAHSSGKHPCVICSCTFQTLFTLDGHIRGAHKVNPSLSNPFGCDPSLSDNPIKPADEMKTPTTKVVVDLSEPSASKEEGTEKSTAESSLASKEVSSLGKGIPKGSKLSADLEESQQVEVIQAAGSKDIMSEKPAVEAHNIRQGGPKRGRGRPKKKILAQGSTREGVPVVTRPTEPSKRGREIPILQPSSISLRKRHIVAPLESAPHVPNRELERPIILPFRLKKLTIDVIKISVPQNMGTKKDGKELIQKRKENNRGEITKPAEKDIEKTSTEPLTLNEKNPSTSAKSDSHTKAKAEKQIKSTENGEELLQKRTENSRCKHSTASEKAVEKTPTKSLKLIEKTRSTSAKSDLLAKAEAKKEGKNTVKRTPPGRQVAVKSTGGRQTTVETNRRPKKAVIMAHEKSDKKLSPTKESNLEQNQSRTSPVEPKKPTSPKDDNDGKECERNVKSSDNSSSAEECEIVFEKQSPTSKVKPGPVLSKALTAMSKGRKSLNESHGKIKCRQPLPDVLIPKKANIVETSKTNHLVQCKPPLDESSETRAQKPMEQNDRGFPKKTVVRRRSPSPPNENAKWYQEFMKFMCSRCGSSFESNANLTVHFQSCGETVNVFPCGLCTFKFNTLLKMKEHLWKVHKPEHERRTAGKGKTKTKSSAPSAPSPQSPSSSKTSSSDQYICKLCNTRLQDKKAYILHISVPHMFRCRKCSFVCKTKPEMEYHKESTHRKKPAGMKPELVDLGDANPSEELQKEASQEGTQKKTDNNTSPRKPKPRRPTGFLVAVTDLTECEQPVHSTDTPEECNVSAKEDRVSGEVGKNSHSQGQPLNTGDLRLGVSKRVQPSVSVRISESSADKSESLICQECGYLAMSLKDSKEHHQSLIDDESLICDVCAFIAGTGCELVLHKKLHNDLEDKSNSETILCNVAEKPSSPGKEHQAEMGDIQPDTSCDVDMEAINMFSDETVQEVTMLPDDISQDSGLDAGMVLLFNLSEVENEMVKAHLDDEGGPSSSGPS